MDVDERTELAQAYLDLKKQYDALVRRNVAGVYRTTLDGRMIECNDALAHMLGYADREALLRLSARDLYPEPEDRDVFLKELMRHKKLVNHESVLRHRSGKNLHVLENVFLEEGPGRSATLQGTLIEISRYKEAEAEQRDKQERVRLQMAEEVNQVLREEIEGHRRTQDALRRSKQFARNLIDSSLDMIMAADADGRITEYNPAASLKFGYEPEEVLGNNTVQLYADAEEYTRIRHELDTHGAYAGEVHNVDKWGNPFTCYLAASLLYDEQGQLIGAMGVSRDITRMKADQEALRLSEERYRDLFDNATDLIQSVD
ncbi:MAG TPA: PAS domain-containing protein, partial [Flavobacteriales bacterium]|nr:PAS domain-containing protein [Flavobacteriales bacterium]